MGRGQPRGKHASKLPQWVEALAESSLAGLTATSSSSSATARGAHAAQCSAKGSGPYSAEDGGIGLTNVASSSSTCAAVTARDFRGAASSTRPMDGSPRGPQGLLEGEGQRPEPPEGRQGGKGKAPPLRTWKDSYSEFTMSRGANRNFCDGAGAFFGSLEAAPFNLGRYLSTQLAL